MTRVLSKTDLDAHWKESFTGQPATPDVPEIRLDAPPIGEAEVVGWVQDRKGGWRDLGQVAKDDKAAKLAALREANRFVEIPEVELYTDEELRAMGW